MANKAAAKHIEESERPIISPNKSSLANEMFSAHQGLRRRRDSSRRDCEIDTVPRPSDHFLSPKLSQICILPFSPAMEEVTQNQRRLLPKGDSFPITPQASASSSTSQAHLTQNTGPPPPEQGFSPPLLQPQAKHSAHSTPGPRRWPKAAPKSDMEWNRVKDLIVKHHIKGDKSMKDVVDMIVD